MVNLRVSGASKCYRITKGGTPLAAMIPDRFAALRPGGSRIVKKEIWALRDVSFKVSRGSIVGVIGANGAGKSTLLKVLARTTPLTAGRIEVKGRVVPMLELGGAFQPDATGKDNVYLNAALYGIPSHVVDRRLDSIVEFAGIQDFIDTPVKRYSSGMYLRLAFSVAVNMEPDILLADEILAVGDLAFQEQCLRRVEEASTDGLTVLFVSHDMAAIRRMCDRVIWLNNGQVVEDGEPDAVVQAYEESMWALVAGNEHGGSHVNDYGEILHTRLISQSGDEIGAVRVSEAVVVRIAVRLHRPGAGFRCVLVFAAEGVDAFRTVQPSLSPAYEPGAYFADVVIPAHLLADTVYTVKTGVWIAQDGQEDRRIALVLHNALTFRVYDTDESDSARGTYLGSLKGVVRPRLDWSVSQAQEGMVEAFQTVTAAD